MSRLPSARPSPVRPSPLQPSPLQRLALRVADVAAQCSSIKAAGSGMALVLDASNPMDGDPSAQELAAVDAALVCIARYGLAKTTIADVANQARISRATLYRRFPGRENLFQMVLTVEYQRFDAYVRSAVNPAVDLADLLAKGLHAGVGFVASHQALGRVLAHEPDLILPFLALDQGDVVLEAGGQPLRGPLQAYLTAEDAVWVSTWIARIGLTYLLGTEDAKQLSTVEQCRTLIDAFVAPALTDLQS